MVLKFKSIALAGALIVAASPVFAEDILAPLFAPITSLDMDPLHIFTPAAAPAAAPAPMVKKHHAKHHMKKKMKK
jgi:hypothetical protein